MVTEKSSLDDMMIATLALWYTYIVYIIDGEMLNLIGQSVLAGGRVNLMGSSMI